MQDDPDDVFEPGSPSWDDEELESVQDGFENRTGNAPRGPVVGADKNNPFVITDSSDDEEDLTHNFNIFNDQKPLAKLGDEKHGADMDQATTKPGGGEPSLSLDEVIDKALNDFTQIYGTSFKDGILTILRDRELLQSFAARVKKHATAPFRKQVANPHWSKQQVLECCLRATLNTPAGSYLLVFWPKVETLPFNIASYVGQSVEMSSQKKGAGKSYAVAVL
jgi:hypothetical protein